MKLSLLSTVVLALLTAVAHGQAPAAPSAPARSATQPAGPTTQQAVDPMADQVLRQMCDYLAETKALSVHAEAWKDIVLPSGHKIQVTRTETLTFRRPDRLHVEQMAHHKGRAIWYDGKTVTVLDRERGTYGQVDAPATIDQTLDLLADKYGITVPLEDLAVSDPYASAMRHVTAGGYFGEETVLGVRCRHVGFSTDRIDWQLWVADAPQPLPQKLVITYKTEDQSPQYTALFSKWSLTVRAADLTFEFDPPRGSERIPMRAEAAAGAGDHDAAHREDHSQANHETDHKADGPEK